MSQQNHAENQCAFSCMGTEGTNQLFQIAQMHSPCMGWGATDLAKFFSANDRLKPSQTPRMVRFMETARPLRTTLPINALVLLRCKSVCFGLESDQKYSLFIKPHWHLQRTSLSWLRQLRQSTLQCINRRKT